MVTASHATRQGDQSQKESSGSGSRTTTTPSSPGLSFTPVATHSILIWAPAATTPISGISGGYGSWMEARGVRRLRRVVSKHFPGLAGPCGNRPLLPRGESLGLLHVPVTIRQHLPSEAMFLPPSDSDEAAKGTCVMSADAHLPEREGTAGTLEHFCQALAALRVGGRAGRRRLYPRARRHR